ncbi:kumamolisin [Aliidongia dinghuensis]|uniref:Kumamolisin n=1 Tax=Aliidongia dinghuensis TaxID=1867774 RepID=A0A8J2YY01_9PROT|nr:S53 family peptidase [Aliidongia dinghuensis]GGF33972.1 kumamolisin [Aliidongia dinghuensis]
MAERRYLPLEGSVRKAPTGATLLGPVDQTQLLTVSVYLRPHAKPPLGARLDHAGFARDYGARPANVARIERYAADHGLMVADVDPARRLVRLAGTVDALCRAFRTKLDRYGVGAGEHRGRSGPLYVGDDIADLVLGVFGLDDRPQARAQYRLAPAAAAATSFTAPEIAQLYDFPPGDGSGETIALIELGGGFVQSDLDGYFKALGLATPTVTAVPVDAGRNTPTGDPNGPDGEVMLDIEVAGAVAPGATIGVYFAPNTEQGFIDAITQAIHDTKLKPSVLSISWGAPESTWTQQAVTVMDQAFQTAASLGVTVCVAAGDGGSSDGATDGLAHADFPASSPNVLGCGGTHVTAATDGTAIASETVWNDGAQGGAGGGGISALFPVPAYQQDLALPPSANAGAGPGRGVPDVAGNADPQSGYQVLVDGQATVIGGTSAVAPLWAGLIARLNGTLGQPVGFINPFLYAHAATCHDITQGNNGAYEATQGWDACTGLGSPDGSALLAALQAAGATPSPAPSPTQASA